MPTPPSRPLLLVALLSAWLIVVLGPPCLFYAWRGRRLAELATPDAQLEWEAFREDMRRQSDGSGPVKRKVPKSPEPPELVWLRDHALLAVIAWMTLAGVLGGVLAALVLGVAGSAAEQEPPGDRHHEKHHDREDEHAGERKHD